MSSFDRNKKKTDETVSGVLYLLSFFKIKIKGSTSESEGRHYAIVVLKIALKISRKLL